MLHEMTPEQRLEMQRKAKAKREKLKEDSKKLKLDYVDKPHWKELASSLGLQLPVYYYSADAKQVRKVLRKLGKDSYWYKNFTGLSKAEDFLKSNPTAPAFMFMGICMEQIEYEKVHGVLE